MATKKKLLQAAAGQAGGAALNVEDVFSTYLYTGNESNLTITNGIDLSGEGGMVWAKKRNSSGYDNCIQDTERGAGKNLKTNSTGAEQTFTDAISSFNSDGFSFTGGGGSLWNQNTAQMASWTFRKAPKFFTCVTWTGTGGARTISHSLNTTVGTIIVKQTNASNNWFVYHRSLSTGSYPDAEDNFLMLNSTNAANDTTLWNSTAPTSTDFTVSNTLNTSSNTYVAYLFAHNDGDGDFGPTGDQDIIKCGSINTSTDGTEVNLGWEPQFVIFKRSDTTSDWAVNDTMRGFGPGSWKLLRGNTTAAEAEIGTDFGVTSTGFICSGFGTGNYIYIAIRRGPMAVPESATDVFAVDTLGGGPPGFQLGNPVDMALRKVATSTADWQNSARLISGKFLKTNSTSVETASSEYVFDYQNGWNSSSATDTNTYSWMWKRAPNFFDAVAYTGTGTTNVLNHNLGVPPEFIILKRRDGVVNWWTFFNFTSTTLDRTELNRTDPADLNLLYSPGYGIQSQPTDTQVEISPYNNTNWNATSAKYIMYLFASLDGISKIGTYTGNGTTQNIDCGFTSGARFVLIKRISGVGSWHLFDATRGIVSGNDPHLALNVAASEITTDDSVDPLSSGFTVNQVSATDVNVSSSTYLYYAIA